MKIGAIPIMSLPAHRDAEIFVLRPVHQAHARACPARFKDFSHQALSKEVRQKTSEMSLQFVSGEPVEDGFISITALLNDKIEERMSPDSLRKCRPDPLEPALFQLSGGTTGVPKIIPRTHNDYSLNFKSVAKWCDVDTDCVLGIAIPVNHNFALSCPGSAGRPLRGRQGGSHFVAAQ